MEKTGAVAALGQAALLTPALVDAALQANERLKRGLTALQAAWVHAHAGTAQAREPGLRSAETVGPTWLAELVATAVADQDAVVLPHLQRMRTALADDLATMARPLAEGGGGEHAALLTRVAHWRDWLAAQSGERLTAAQLADLTAGRRDGEDGFHVLVMDLHKALNRLAAAAATDEVDGAHVWGLQPGDEELVRAFMRGLARTRSLKLDHPGLATAATRDGETLLIQNDIGTNDAHVLVLEVRDLVLTLSYADLHPRRFAFFRRELETLGAAWSNTATHRQASLNAGVAFHLGSARIVAADRMALVDSLEALAARIVFLIDWNRARKRLDLLVKKSLSVEILTECARREVGHLPWLAAGGERLVFDAMEAMGPEHFRIGDRLDAVMGEIGAKDFLIEAMSLATQAMLDRRPQASIADSVRLLLGRHVGRRRDAFELLEEHAAYCQALAAALRDGLVHGFEHDAPAALRLAERAKAWEHQADLLVTRARALAERNPGWAGIARLVERADDAADALEDAAFVLATIAECGHGAWHASVRETLGQLAETTLAAARDHVRATAFARLLGDDATADDHEAFLALTWRIVAAERDGDTLLREARRRLAHHTDQAAPLVLATDLALAMEACTDMLMHTSFGLRDLALHRAGNPS